MNKRVCFLIPTTVAIGTPTYIPILLEKEGLAVDFYEDFINVFTLYIKKILNDIDNLEKEAITEINILDISESEKLQHTQTIKNIVKNKKDEILLATTTALQPYESELQIQKEKESIRNKILEDPIVCGQGTILKDGKCVVDTSQKLESEPSLGGGCLIATATYGSELAPQVQQLRELRDNKLLQTESGISFMKGFNHFYYSFSPIIADYELENPVFKEAVKLAITPMISSLYILNYVDMDSEAEVLGYGISLILLNIGMYVGVPIATVVGIRKQTRLFMNS